MPQKLKVTPSRELPRPVSLEQWAKDDVKRQQLVEILENPVFQDAMETLESSYAPSVPSYVASESSSVIPSQADLNNLLALRHVHRAGYFGFANALRNLTREKILKRADRSPWGDLVPTE